MASRNPIPFLGTDYTSTNSPLHPHSEHITNKLGTGSHRFKRVLTGDFWGLGMDMPSG